MVIASQSHQAEASVEGRKQVLQGLTSESFVSNSLSEWRDFVAKEGLQVSAGDPDALTLAELITSPRSYNQFWP